MGGNMAFKNTQEQREYQRLWMKRRRNEFFAGKKCLHCGSTLDLEIHHRDPVEKESHRIWSWSQGRRDAELKKCDVLCSICHAEFHAGEMQRHGTRCRYQAGCRCDACVRQMQKIWGRWKANKMARDVAKVA